jgi:hypothetical protein
LWTSATAAEITEQTLPDEFTDVIRKLSSWGDRSTGTLGNQEAGIYIREKFEQLGFETVGSYRFSVPIMQHAQSTVSIPDRNLQIGLRPITSNAVTPQTVRPPGISGPLVYVAQGELHQFNRKQIENSILLMELDSGKSWLNAANLGAKALIYIDRGQSPRVFFEDKMELSPLQFPRFWMPLAKAKEVFGDFEKTTDGQVAAEIQLVSQINWQVGSAENIYCLIPGTDPELQEKLVMVEAFYDSSAMVAGLSPGADEAVSVAIMPRV